jgi:hypothetical protein
MANEIDEPIGTFVVAKMVEFSLTIASNNEAFSEGNGPVEVARILRETADKLESDRFDGRLADVNGNTVGEFFYSENQ